MSDSEQRQANRTRFLRRLYEVTGGNIYQPASVEEIAQYIGLASDEADAIVSYLEQKYSLKWSTMGLVVITQYGIDEAEQAIKSDQPQSKGPRISPQVIGEIATAFDQAYSHNELTVLFSRLGFPDPEAIGTKPLRVTAWLQRIDADSTADAQAVLGRFLEDFMDQTLRRIPPENLDRLRNRIHEALAASGLSYHPGGRIFGGEGLLSPSKSLDDFLRDRNLPAVRKEFERAYDKLVTDPADAVTAACAILEATCKTIIAEENLTLPSDQTLQPLWRVVRGHLGLAPTSELQDDLKKILGGLASVVDGVGAFRTHAGDAHGRGPDARPIDARHARLAVHAAHTVVMFVLETWTAQRRTP